METRPEILLSVEGLTSAVAKRREAGQTVVMCHGVFDLLHIGHIRHFEQAKAHGDVLIVTLTPDQFVNKGTHRPAFPELLRAEAIASLGIVDYVAINEWPTAENTLKTVRPDVFCKGGEYRQRQLDADVNLGPEVEAAKELGLRIEFTEGLVFSSSKLLNRHFSPFSPEQESWLHAFRERHEPEEVLGHIDELNTLKAVVVGEAIIDEYVFCDAIGKSTKDPVLACQSTGTETFAGGSLAIANHLAGFCQEVTLICALGDMNRQEAFVRSALLPNVKPILLTQKNAPTISKRRYVDRYTQAKLLEIYEMDDRPLKGDEETALLDAIYESVRDADVTVAADYGHGFLTSKVIDTLCNEARFLAINTQSNAGNRGFNPVSKYRRGDYVCLAQHEVSIETRMRDGEPRDLLDEITQRIDCDQFTVTRGKFGTLHYEKDVGYTEVPSFATQVSDRVGAGDAVFALTSLLVAQKAPWDIVGLAGNLAGAQMVTELGNRVPLTKIPIEKHIVSLMK
ncbi:TPA: cytidyltransferase [Candidatus Latescibacteria bacterium]|nr:cytidyltransferase [Candidatus Latescibacterota bacterium]